MREPPSTLLDMLRWRAVTQRDKLAYRFLLDGEKDEACLTYGDLDRKARAIGATLQSVGKAGDRVLLVYPPGLDFIVAFYGCLYSGLIAVPAYPPRTAHVDHGMRRIMGIVSDTMPVVALTTSSEMKRIGIALEEASELRSLHWLTTDGATRGVEDTWREPALGPDSLAFLQYTSGSTTAPRGVMVSHGNLTHNLRAIQKRLETSAKSHAVIWLPPYHDMGLIGGILEPGFSGTSATLMSPLAFLQRPVRWLRAITRFQATASCSPNFAYDLCVRKVTPEQRATLNLRSWEVAFNGAEPINATTLKRFTEYFEPCGFRPETFCPCYGLAEATLMVSGGLAEARPVTHSFRMSAGEKHRAVTDTAGRKGTLTLVGCGHTLENQDIAIVDPDSRVRCLPRTVGEIWVSGPSVARGYWHQTAETNHAFHARIADTGEGPFLRTGDLGFLADGELFVTGRLKELIIVDGMNHYPQDIERTVTQCHPSVTPGGCAAFSINPAGEEQLVVVTEVRRQSGPDIEEITRAVRRAVADHHDLHVHDLVFLETGHVPKTPSGKIQRYICKAAYLNGTSLQKDST